MEFDKKTNTYKIVMAVIVTALITIILTSIGVYNFLINTKEGNTDLLANYFPISKSTEDVKAKIEIVKRYLQNHYIGNLDEKNMSEYAIKGYVAGLKDEYTEYLTKDEYDDLLISVTGNYVGIGVYMTQLRTGEIVVLMPIEGSPAEEVGLKTGDIIEKVNGEDCTGVDIELVSNKIKGVPGTKVDLEILRDTEKINLTVERRKIEIKAIDSKIIEKNIGYIKLLSFDEGATEKFREHLEKLNKQNIKSLIIDLRNNGGGIVDEVIGIAELFVPRGSVIMKSYDKDAKETVIKSSNAKPQSLKMVVLVNENSASAAEIFTAAMKDNKIATIVGKTTFGKGVMQEVIELPTGGALKVTIEEFKTPNGDTINKKGIKPDIEVELERNSKEDLQLNKAIEKIKN